MNIITDVNNLTKTVGDSIKEFLLLLLSTLVRLWLSSHASLALFSVLLRQSTPFTRTEAAMIFGVTLSALPSQFLESSYLRCCGRASQAIFDPIKAAPGFHWGRLYIEVTR